MNNIASEISLAFSYPGKKEINFFSSNSLISFKDISDIKDLNGFVIKPFNNNEFGYLIPEEKLIKDSSIKIIEDRGLYSFTSIDKNNYLIKAAQIIKQLKDKVVKKLVFSRVIQREVSSEQLIKSFQELNLKHPNAFVYFVSIKNVGTWIGATPEKLLVVDDNYVAQTVSLAGTKKNIDNSAWGEKEIEEQEIVTSYISNQINSLNLKYKLSDKFELKAGNVKHLCNEFLISDVDKFELNLV